MNLQPVQLAFIQPTTFCNINCEYCYLPNRDAPRRMSSETLRHAFEFLFRRPELLGNPLRCLWHAGEPLSVPQAFYEEAFEIQQALVPPQISVENSIVTNATLLNDKWCEFIRRCNVRLGVSLDGPKDVHDRKRVDRSDRGTFDRVIRGIELLQTYGIPFHVMAVISDYSLDRPTELWECFTALNIRRLHLLIESKLGLHVNRILEQNKLLERLETFFDTLLQLRVDRRYDMYIRELDNAFYKIGIWPVQFREIEQYPVGIINISWDGCVSTLGPDLMKAHLAGYGSFALGNVVGSELDSLVENGMFKTVYHDILAGFRRCESECPYFSVCGGGQPSNKFYENGSFNSTETPSCQMRIKAPMNTALKFLERRAGLSQIPSLSVDERITRVRQMTPIPPVALDASFNIANTTQ